MSDPRTRLADDALPLWTVARTPLVMTGFWALSFLSTGLLLQGTAYAGPMGIVLGMGWVAWLALNLLFPTTDAEAALLFGGRVALRSAWITMLVGAAVVLWGTVVLVPVLAYLATAALGCLLVLERTLEGITSLQIAAAKRPVILNE